MSGTNGCGPVMVSASCDSASALGNGYTSHHQHQQHLCGLVQAEEITFTPCDPKQGLSALQQFASGTAVASAAVAAAAAVEPVAPGSTAWQAATELIRLQGQDPTIPLVTLVAARLLAQQRQQLQQQREARQGAHGEPLAAAAAPARGNLTRFCKRGSSFVAKPVRSAAAPAAASGPSRASDCNGSARSSALQQLCARQKGRTTCQVDGCLVDLPLGKDTYNGRYRVCPQHMVDPAVVLCADTPQQLYRFCNQCFKFEPLSAFDGVKRGCRASLAKRRERQRAKKLGVPPPKAQPRKKRQQEQREENADEDVHQQYEEQYEEQREEQYQQQYSHEQEHDHAMELEQQQQYMQQQQQQQVLPGTVLAPAAAAAPGLAAQNAAPPAPVPAPAELGPMQALLLSQMSLPGGALLADVQAEMGRDLMDMPSLGEADFMKSLLEELGGDTVLQDQTAAAAPFAALPRSWSALQAMQQDHSSAPMQVQPPAHAQQQQQQCWPTGNSMGQVLWQPDAAAAGCPAAMQQQHASLSPLQLQQLSVLPMQAVQNGAAAAAAAAAAAVNPRRAAQLLHIETASAALAAALQTPAAASPPSVFNRPASSSSSEGGSSSSDSQSDASGQNKAPIGVGGSSRSSECDSCSSAAASAAQQKQKQAISSQQQQRRLCILRRSSFHGSAATVVQGEDTLAAAAASPLHRRRHKKRSLQEEPAAAVADLEMAEAQPASAEAAVPAAAAAAAQPPSLAAAWQQLLQRQPSATAAGVARAGSPDPAPLRTPTEDFHGLEELLNQHHRASSAPPGPAQNLGQDLNMGQISKPGSEPWTSERLGSNGVPAGFLASGGRQAAGQMPNPVLLATAAFGSGVYDAMLEELSSWYTNANTSDQQAAAAAMAAAVAAPLQQQQQQQLVHPPQPTPIESTRASCEAAAAAGVAVDVSATTVSMQQQQPQLEQWQQQQDDLLLPPCTNTPPMDLMTNQSPFKCPAPMSSSIVTAAVSGPVAPGTAAAAMAPTGSTARCGSAGLLMAAPMASTITSPDRMQQQQKLSAYMNAPLPAHVAAECWRQQEQQQSLHSCMSEPAQMPWQQTNRQQQQQRHLLSNAPLPILAENWSVSAAIDDVAAAAVAAAAAAAAKNADLEGKLVEVQQQMKQMQEMIMALKAQQQPATGAP